MLTVDLQKLKALRKSKMSLDQMSSHLGYQSPNGYYYLETGRSRITAETLAKVATILGVPIEEFFVEKDEKDE